MTEMSSQTRATPNDEMSTRYCRPPVRGPVSSLLLVFGRRAIRLMRRKLLTVGKQLASPPRFATALRAGGPPSGPPHLIVISGSYHALVVLTYIHSGPYLAGPDLFLSDSPSEVIERHRLQPTQVGTSRVWDLEAKALTTCRPELGQLLPKNTIEPPSQPG